MVRIIKDGSARTMKAFGGALDGYVLSSVVGLACSFGLYTGWKHFSSNPEVRFTPEFRRQALADDRRRVMGEGVEADKEWRNNMWYWLLAKVGGVHRGEVEKGMWEAHARTVDK